MDSANRWALDHLARFAAPGGPDMRPTLLRVLTELYVQKPTHTADEERHYTELALGLLDATDVSTRAAVAQRLAHYASSPRPDCRQCRDRAQRIVLRSQFRRAASHSFEFGCYRSISSATYGIVARKGFKRAIGSRRFIPQSRGLRSTTGPGSAHFPVASAMRGR